MNPARLYLDTHRQTASRERLMLMLFDAALANIRTGAELLEFKRKLPASRPLIRATEIVAVLRQTLDPSRDTALCRNLTDVYVFVEARLIAAYSGGDPRHAREAERVLAPIAAAFTQVIATAQRAEIGGAL